MDMFQQATYWRLHLNSKPPAPPVHAQRAAGNRKLYATFRVPNAHGTDRHKYELKYENTSGGAK